ncbi:hypothetical protein FACS1894190_17900 [Spirochaetia bacterium]|nr:hypothetical protein FACS1894190_17900 [Spirochaetia bacterium]
MYKKLEKTDKVAIEAGNPAFGTAKETRKQVGCETVVPNSAKLAIIYAPVKKTGKEDALKLARLISVLKDEQLSRVSGIFVWVSQISLDINTWEYQQALFMLKETTIFN